MQKCKKSDPSARVFEVFLIVSQSLLWGGACMLLKKYKKKKKKKPLLLFHPAPPRRLRGIVFSRSIGRDLTAEKTHARRPTLNPSHPEPTKPAAAAHYMTPPLTCASGRQCNRRDPGLGPLFPSFLACRAMNGNMDYCRAVFGGLD